jgi:hypothetical protein
VPSIPGWSKRVAHDIEERPIDVAEHKFGIACRPGRLQPAAEVHVNFAADRISP